jgi:hypothetical protein
MLDLTFSETVLLTGERFIDRKPSPDGRMIRVTIDSTKVKATRLAVAAVRAAIVANEASQVLHIDFSPIKRTPRRFVVSSPMTPCDLYR